MTTEIDDPQLFEAFSEEFDKLSRDHQQIVLSISPLEAWAVLCNVQLAIRHPENRGPTASIAGQIARDLQERVAPGGALAIVAARGWNAGYDEAPTPDPAAVRASAVLAPACRYCGMEEGLVVPLMEKVNPFVIDEIELQAYQCPHCERWVLLEE